MSIFRDFLDKLFSKSENGKIELNAVSVDTGLEKELWAYRLGLNIITNLFGSLLSKCEFRTFSSGEEIKGDNYWLLNNEPNVNQTAAEFKKQIIRQLILSHDHECLIVQLTNVGDKKNAFYVADSFDKDEYQLRETYFKNVTINLYDETSLPLEGIFSGTKAIYFKYCNSELDAILTAMKQTYTELITNAIKSGLYRQKYVLSYDQTAEGSPDFEETLQDIVDNQFESFIKGDNGVIPLYSGMKLDTVSAGADLGQNASVANSTVDNQIDQILTKVGLAFNVPKNAMLGEINDAVIDHILTFCIDPIANMISEAFNRRWYGKDAVISKSTYCVLDTAKARHYDIANMGQYMDKAFSTGAYSINELRRLTNDPPIDPSIGDVHFVTKNYISINDYLKEGGNEND